MVSTYTLSGEREKLCADMVMDTATRVRATGSSTARSLADSG